MSSYAFTTTYDAAGRPASVAYPTINFSGAPTTFTASFTYTAQGGYLKTVESGGTVFYQPTAADAEQNLTAETLGNGVQTRRTYNPYTGLVSTIASSTNGFSGGTPNDLQDEAYTFDDVGNLIQREDLRQSVMVSGSTVPLSESFTYDADNRVLSAQVVGQSAKAYAYNLLGNLISKSGVGTLTYGTGGVRPHAVTAAGSWTYTYDANGNRLQQKLGSTVVGQIDYTPFNMPSTVMTNGASMTFSYDANRERVKQTTNSGSTLLYIGGPARVELEKSPPVGGVSTWTHTHYVTANGKLVAQRKWTGTHNGTTETKTAGPVDQYFHTDHLGSIVAVTNASKVVLERFSHETWGQRRNATGWTDATTPPTSNHTTRGYTGHEQLDLVGLVHMNGRVHDRLLGRFTSADPTIQYADNPQSYNRYSYVLNNPLSFTEPSGYGLFSFIKKIFKAVVKVVKAVFRVVKSFVKNPEMLAALAIAANPGLWAGLTGGILGPVGSFGAVFSQGFASGLIASKGDLEDGLISAVTAVGFSSMHGWDVKSASFGEKALKATAHGAVGGLSSLAQGGSFQSGFLSAGTVQAFSNSNLFGMIGVTDNPNGFGDYAANATAAAIVGGTASVIGGGEFANGAMTGAFSRLFNELRIVGDDRYRARIAAARSRLPALDAALASIEASSRVIYLRANGYGVNEFMGAYDSWRTFGVKDPTIVWDGETGLRFQNGTQSATLGLYHEAEHGVGWLTDPDGFSMRQNIGAGKYGTWEEARVIRGPEAAAARFLGEPIRYCHECGQIVRSNR